MVLPITTSRAGVNDDHSYVVLAFDDFAVVRWKKKGSPLEGDLWRAEGKTLLLPR